MRILITTGLSDEDVGGPSQYASNLTREFSSMGYEVRTALYGHIEKVLPIGVRHLYFFLKILPSVLWADRIIALDTFSVGVPSIFTSILLRKKLIVRVGGDFLWESYVNRTSHMIILPKFYNSLQKLNLKEKAIFHLTKFLVRKASAVVFNTEWQKNIWQKAYKIQDNKIYLIRNLILTKSVSVKPMEKLFLCQARDTKIKNLEMLKEVARIVKSRHSEFNLEILAKMPHDKLLDRVKSSYAVMLPSLSEVCPNFILEAMSFNRPFIVTQETGLKEIYNKGGVFIDPLNLEDIVSSVEKMLDTEEYNRYVKELELFDLERPWGKVAEEFVSICKHL